MPIINEIIIMLRKMYDASMRRRCQLAVMLHASYQT